MQRYFAKDKIDNFIILEDSDLHHIKNVMRMNVNDKIECVYDCKLYICGVSFDNRFEILEEVQQENINSRNVTVCVGLVKEQKMDLILQKLTELGVNRIIPVSMERSIVKLDNERFKKKKVRWQTICKEASEQSKRLDIPEITDLMSLKELNSIKGDLKLVCSVREKENFINKCLQENDNCATIVFVIGPEGGISDREEDVLNSYGYKSISLGNLVLRVETACIYVASIIQYCSMG